jgi:hypothetical protein
MKRIWLVLICLLSFVHLRADEVDQLILSYSGNRRGFEWARVDAVDRVQLVARLREISEGKRTTVAGGYGIGASTAERMLVDIGDEGTIRDVVKRYHTQRVGPTNIADVVELGQALAIPYLAVDLVSEEFLIYDLKKPDGQVVTVQDTHDSGKRMSSARNIVGVIENSRQFPQAVRESAGRIKPTLTSSRQAFIDQVTDWWLQNEQQLVAGDFTQVSPLGESKAQPAMRSVAMAGDQTSLPTAHSSAPKQAGPKSVATRPPEPQPANYWWLWIVGTALALGVGLLFMFKKRL